jgi:hypothetical protein
MDEFRDKMDEGARLWQSGQFQQAAEVFRKASQLSPKDPIARANYAIALAKSGDLEKALPVLEQTAADGNEIPDLFLNLGNVYRLMLRLTDAARAYERAIALRGNYAEAHWAHSLTLLLAGDFSNGWRGFDWRFRLPGRKSMPFVGQTWNGSLDSLRGKQLMLGAEQGFGDTIQFARYITVLNQAGAKVTLVCQPELKTLLASVPRISHVMTPGDPIPRYELHAALMSVGKLLGTDLQTIPAAVPYLTANPDKRARWRARLEQLGGGKKVGLVWAGRPTHTNDHNRSIRLAEFAPLKGAANIHWISLQKGPAVDQIRASPLAGRITDYGSECADFSDTAALVAELDLVLTVDTSVGHLAGALAKPVWVLLPYLPDWRWLLNRTDSPWYPTMKLFRQPAAGRWADVFDVIAGELQGTAQAG